MREITETAPAKINLFLHIQGRLDNGYHLLESLVVFSDLGDRITVRPAAEFRLTLNGPFANALSDENNIVAKAAALFADVCGAKLGVEIHLQKNLPIGAGVGGGSADAAATLRALQRYTGIELGHTVVQEIAIELGADVPVCLQSKPAVMTGVGERLKFLNKFPACAILLVNPKVHVDTGSVFKALDLTQCPKRPAFDGDTANYRDLIAALADTGNDLIPPATQVTPVIKSVLNEVGLGDANGMTGSGATCFAVFPTLSEAEAAAEELQERHPNWWIAASVIHAMTA
jgi:4-diphosphocytidyl-2-C-methyl-D-erythritol kinase